MNTRLSGDTRDNPLQRADTTRTIQQQADKAIAEVIAQLRADRDAARKLCEENLTWLMSRCSMCGHRLRSDLPASHSSCLCTRSHTAARHRIRFPSVSSNSSASP